MAEECATPLSPSRRRIPPLVLGMAALALVCIAIGLWVQREVRGRVRVDLGNDGEVALAVTYPGGAATLEPGARLSVEVDEGAFLRFTATGREGAPPWTAQVGEKRARGEGYSRSETVGGKRLSLNVRSVP